MVDGAIRRLPESLYRALVVVFVLYLSYFFGQHPSRLILVLPVAAAGALVLLTRPELGVLALIPAALVVPIAIGTGTLTTINAVIMLVPALVLLWIFLMVQTRGIRLAPSPTNLPLAVFGLSATISFLAGNISWSYFAASASMMAQLGGLAIFLFSAAAFLIVGNLVKEAIWLQRMVWLFIGLGALYIAGRVVPGGWVIANLFPSGATGSLFWMWLAALSASQALLNGALKPSYRAALLLLVLAELAVGFIQGRSWVSGWAPAIVALGILAWLRSWRLGLAVTVAGLILVAVFRPMLPQETIALDEYSIATRGDAAEIMLRDVLPANPILGLGPANYYYYTPLYPLRGYYISFNSHNQYLDILAQTGIVGLVAFLWLMLAIARLGWRIFRRAQDSFARAYACACLAGLAGTLASGFLGDWFIPFIYNIGFDGFRSSVLAWLFLGGLVILQNHVGEPQTESV